MRPGSRWIEALAPALALGAFALVFGVMPWRGMNLWGVWLGEASDAVSAWMRGDGGGWDGASLDRAWGGHAALPPLSVALVSAARALGLSYARASHLAGALGVAFTVLPVWGFGRRAGGVPAAITAALAFLLLPRTVGHGSMAGFSAVAGCLWTWAAYALYRARTSARWTVAAGLFLGLAPLATHVALLLPLPWLVLLGSEPPAPGAAPAPGLIRPRAVPLRLLAVLPLAAGVLLAAYPWLWAAPKERLASYLTHFLIQPKEPLLYLGDLLTTQRLPWHGGPVLLVTTVPPTLAILGVFGLFGEILLRPVLQTRLGSRLRPWLRLRPDPEAAGPEARVAKRWAFTFLLAALALPWFAGAPVFGVVDLLALATPCFAVFVGCTLSRLFSATAAVVEARVEAAGQGRAGRAALIAALAALGALVFAPAAMDTVRAQPTAEGYHAWIVGGAEGALAKGFARAPYAPVPLPVARYIAQQPGRAALLADASAWRRVLERYRRDAVIPHLPPWAEPFQADLLILPHADADPRYYDAAADFARAIPPNRSVTLRADGVRVVSVGQR